MWRLQRWQLQLTLQFIFGSGDEQFINIKNSTFVYIRYNNVVGRTYRITYPGHGGFYNLCVVGYSNISPKAMIHV